jgi:hypothetical protein
MAYAQRLVSLHHQHDVLKDLLEAEYKHPHPNDALIRQLKHDKLAIKDQIVMLERMVEQDLMRREAA